MTMSSTAAAVRGYTTPSNEAKATTTTTTTGGWQWRREGEEECYCFKMPLHYPRYTRAHYEAMDEKKLDLLLEAYGLKPRGTLAEKREEAMGHFLWS